MVARSPALIAAQSLSSKCPTLGTADTAPAEASGVGGSGEQLGVSRQAVIALETERHDPSLDLAYRIAALFEKPAEEIFPNPHRKRTKR